MLRRVSARSVFFASCAPGLEPVLHREARDLRLARVERQVGGVYFEGTLEDAWRANLGLRTAIRVFLRLARFDAPDADALYRGVREVDWSRFVEPEGTLIVDSQTRESQLFHTHFVQQRVKDAVVDQMRARHGVRPSVSADDPELYLHVHLFRDRATLSVDTSGGSLHKRGWRVHQGRAPLSETLAAAVVLLSGWDRRSPLIDPFCGSGTVAIEAAAIAAGAPPGGWRRFGFERWPGHDAGRYEAFRAAERARARRPAKVRILASDLDDEQVRGARDNAESAGFADWLEIERADALELSPKPGWNAWIVTNPPYGVRLGEERELEPLYDAFGERLRERCDGFHLALLSGSAALGPRLGFRRAAKTKLRNGTIECLLLTQRIGDDPRRDRAEGIAVPAERRARRRRRRR
jgi:23S rRNA G2445 N2-methylase RlmL